MRTAEIWSGRGPARALRTAVQERVARLSSDGPLTLRMILVGDDPSAQGYARAVQRGCKRVGVRPVMDKLLGDSSTDAVVNHVRALNADANVHGILLGFPLASHLDVAAVVDAIDPTKDVDRLTTTAIGELFSGHSQGWTGYCRGGDRAARLLRGTHRGSTGRGGGAQQRSGQAAVGHAAGAKCHDDGVPFTNRRSASGDFAGGDFGGRDWKSRFDRGRARRVRRRGG